MNIRDATQEELVDWDAWTVETVGGHVYQSRAWAEHRRASGWTPRFFVGDDGGRTLALTRRWPVVGGGSAYLPRGPVVGEQRNALEVSARGPLATRTSRASTPMTAAPAGKVVAARQIAVAEALAHEGFDVIAADPEIPAADAEFSHEIRAAGFRPIEEIQPSRHRVSLALPAGADEPALFEGVAKSTRQRIRGAIDDGLMVVRHDVRLVGGGAGEGFALPAEPTAAALDRFYDLLLETGERRQFRFGPRAGFVAWWLAAHAAGHLVYLEAQLTGSVAAARAEAADAAQTEATDVARASAVAGLVMYRHGGRLSTVHSGDHAAARARHPGALHLLRWRAIQLAIREGCTEMDLGGVDIAGARREPNEGDPLYGLYQHKRAFGGRWLELSGAHERVFDPRGYALGRLAARLTTLVRR